MAAYLLYDGECGMCHRLVLFVMHRDTRKHFLFIPQDYFDRPTVAARYGDTILVVDEARSVLTYSAAVIEILHHCGPFWRTLSFLVRAVPQGIRDFGYRLVARYRHLFFRRPTTVCPVIPKEFRDRFPEQPPLEIQQLFESRL